MSNIGIFGRDMGLALLISLVVFAVAYTLVYLRTVHRNKALAPAEQQDPWQVMQHMSHTLYWLIPAFTAMALSFLAASSIASYAALAMIYAIYFMSYSLRRDSWKKSQEQ